MCTFRLSLEQWYIQHWNEYHPGETCKYGCNSLSMLVNIQGYALTAQ